MAGKKKADQQDAPKPPRKLAKPTAVHFTYQREAGTVNVGVQQDVSILGTSHRQGVDKQVALKDLPANVQKQLEAAFDALAKAVGAAV